MYGRVEGESIPENRRRRIPATLYFIGLIVAHLPLSAATIILEWDPGIDDSTTGNRLYRGTNSGSYDWSKTIVGTNSTEGTDLKYGRTYFFVITAVNSRGVESELSNELQYTTPPNHAPIALSQSLVVAENSTVDSSAQATDPDLDSVHLTLRRSPVNGTLAGVWPNFTYQPNANFYGNDSFTFSANDGTAESEIATVSISVQKVNHPPVANGQTIRSNGSSLLSLQLTGSDLDRDPITYTLIRQPQNGTLIGTPPTLTYLPRVGLKKNDSFSFSVNDGTAESLPATVTLTASAPNNPNSPSK